MRKNIYTYAILIVAALFSISCEDDDREDLIPQLGTPSELDLEFNITQDNSGLVTISPSGTNVSAFEVFYGDGSGDSVELALGENAQRNYPEGTYDITLIGKSLSGETAQISQQLMVSFRAPENLVSMSQRTQDPVILLLRSLPLQILQHNLSLH